MGLDKVDDVERVIPAVDGAVDKGGAKDPLRVDERGRVTHRVDEVLSVEDVGRVGDGRGRLGLLEEGAAEAKRSSVRRPQRLHLVRMGGSAPSVATVGELAGRIHDAALLRVAADADTGARLRASTQVLQIVEERRTKLNRARAHWK
jgi:hypothetical protein